MIIIWPSGTVDQSGQSVGGSVWSWSGPAGTDPVVVADSPVCATPSATLQYTATASATLQYTATGSADVC